MESESGVETEWGSGRLTGQELLLDLRRKLDKMAIDLGEWTEEGASVKEQGAVWNPKTKHWKLNQKRSRCLSMWSDSGKVTEVDSDSGRNEIIGMLREAKELEVWIKEEKEKQSLMEGKLEVKEAEVKEESESGMETEGQELLLDLGRKLDKMEIDLGEWTEEQETVRILKMKHMKLNQRRRDLSMGSGSGKVTEVDSDPSHNKVIGMLRREVKQLEFMIIKAKKKQLRKKQETAGDSSEEMDRDSGEHQSQSQSLMEEIISVERERKDLFGSLTPTFSRWKEIDSQATWTIARKEPDDTSSTVDNDENQLADYFNLMLQDMEDLGHRMLSMLYFLNKSNDPICSYKATELCNATARLNRHISKEFVTDQEPEPEEEPGQINLLSLFRKYYRFPNNYDNTLAQLDLDMEEDEEENKCEDVKVKKTKEEEEKEKEKEDVSTMEYLKKRMDIDQQFLAKDRKFWENVWGSRIGRCGGFMDTTILSPMQFTHNTPGRIPSPAAIAGSTLQIYSIKIKNLKGLKWPLRVHGEVAARDTVDRNRNILFSRSRFDYQELTGEDDCLCLTGPSRAIVALDHVEFEVDLQVTEGAESKTLMSCRGCYGGTDDFFSSLGSVTDGGDGCTFSLSNDSCRAEVALEQLDRSLQATIVGVRVTEGRWPFKYGCRVVCSWSAASDTTCRRVVLFDHRGRGLRRRSNGYLDLSRRVVSVESHGTLRVGIEAYGKSRRYVAREGHINFSVQQCQTKRLGCRVGDATVEVAVAWSLLVKEKACLSLG